MENQINATTETMELTECYACPYSIFEAIEGATKPKLSCDPPMGECRLVIKEGFYCE